MSATSIASSTASCGCGAGYGGGRVKAVQRRHPPSQLVAAGWLGIHRHARPLRGQRRRAAAPPVARRVGAPLRFPGGNAATLLSSFLQDSLRPQTGLTGLVGALTGGLDDPSLAGPKSGKNTPVTGMSANSAASSTTLLNRRSTTQIRRVIASSVTGVSDFPTQFQGPKHIFRPPVTGMSVFSTPPFSPIWRCPSPTTSPS